MPVYLLSEDLVFPPPQLATEDGLLAVGGDLSPERILTAYENGIFPWYSEGDPILWWSPDPRLVLYPHEFKASKSLIKIVRKKQFHVTFDTAFDQTIVSCAQTRKQTGEGTWITPEMQTAYSRLYELGHAHSVEAWYEGKLVGGLYGLSMGRVFFGESMFAIMSNASKICLYHLSQYLSQKSFRMIDCQVSTDHLIRMGARNIPRSQYLAQLKEAICSA